MKATTAKMAPRTSRSLMFLTGYAVIMTICGSHYFVRDISNQLVVRNRSSQFYEAHFMPARQQASEVFPPASEIFPLASHIVTHGHPRTATTLLFNMVAASYFLHLSHVDPHRIPSVHLQLWKREEAADRILARETDKTYLLKTHLGLDNFKADNTVIFTAAVDREEARETKRRLREEGFVVAFVQDMESLKEDGIAGLVKQYVRGYQLSEEDEMELNEYFT